MITPAPVLKYVQATYGDIKYQGDEAHGSMGRDATVEPQFGRVLGDVFVGDKALL